MDSITNMFRNVKFKPKDMIPIPWMVAMALIADGWYLRSDIIWAKPNPMPESVRDRPTKAHEYVFLMSKSERYYYDAKAIAEPSVCDAGTAGTWNGNRDFGLPGGQTRFAQPNLGGSIDGTRNARTVWTIPTQPFAEAHFATFPEAIPERCIKAGSRPDDIILDPFIGSGTTVRVAERLQRVGIGIDLAYQDLQVKRVRNNQVEMCL
jgi:DNA modification methylase